MSHKEGKGGAYWKSERKLDKTGQEERQVIFFDEHDKSGNLILQQDTGMLLFRSRRRQIGGNDMSIMLHAHIRRDHWTHPGTRCMLFFIFIFIRSGETQERSTP